MAVESWLGSAFQLNLQSKCSKSLKILLFKTLDSAAGTSSAKIHSLILIPKLPHLLNVANIILIGSWASIILHRKGELLWNSTWREDFKLMCPHWLGGGIYKLAPVLPKSYFAILLAKKNPGKNPKGLLLEEKCTWNTCFLSLHFIIFSNHSSSSSLTQSFPSFFRGI